MCPPRGDKIETLHFEYPIWLTLGRYRGNCVSHSIAIWFPTGGAGTGAGAHWTVTVPLSPLNLHVKYLPYHLTRGKGRRRPIAYIGTKFDLPRSSGRRLLLLFQLYTFTLEEFGQVIVGLSNNSRRDCWTQFNFFFGNIEAQNTIVVYVVESSHWSDFDSIASYKSLR